VLQAAAGSSARLAASSELWLSLGWNKVQMGHEECECERHHQNNCVTLVAMGF
jgi:hypothetical protein